MRPLLLRLSVAVDKHTSVIHHAHATLAGLKQHMRAMVADYESRAAELGAQVRVLYRCLPHVFLSKSSIQNFGPFPDV